MTHHQPPSLILSFWCSLLALLLVVGCYEPKEGCLDVTATNFNLDADEECANCCTYPTLKVTVRHRWNDGDTILPLQLNTGIYYDGFGQPFRLRSIRYYLSDVSLQTVSGTRWPPLDSVEVATLGPGGDTVLAMISENVWLANPGNTQSRTLGLFPYPDNYQSASLVFGLSDAANAALPVSLPNGHPLAPQLGGQYRNPTEGYVFLRIELFRDTIASDTVPLVLGIAGAGNRRSLNLPFPGQLALPQGSNALLTLETDYARWFVGANVRGDTSLLKTTILNNLPSSIQAVNFGKE